MAIGTNFIQPQNCQDYSLIMSSPAANLSPLSSQQFDHFGYGFPQATQPFQQQQQQLQQQQQQCFVQGTGRGIGYGKGQDTVSSALPFPSSNDAINGNGNGNSVVNPLSALLDKHRREVDIYLRIQGERLKEAFQQHKKQQMALVLNNYQTKVVVLLREKEQELKKVKAKAKMLEEIVKERVAETEVWQRVAGEKEQLVIELNNMLNLLKQNLPNLAPQPMNNNGDDDAESVADCGSMNNNNATREVSKNSGCKWCNSKDASVVFLRCKHLCCCKECEPLLQFCPLCQSPKQGCLEIFLS